MLNEKGELILLSTENSHSTQQTELEAIEEETSENDTTSENDSNTDEEAEEEYWQKAGKNQGSDDEETCAFATVAIPLPCRRAEGTPPRGGATSDQARPLVRNPVRNVRRRVRTDS